MRFWSEGLGDRELVIGLDRSAVKRTDDVVLLSGVVDSPAPWEYEVKIEYDDWKKILETAVTKEACGFIGRHVTLRTLASMGWSVAKFAALFALYRATRLFALPRAESPVEKPVGVGAEK